MDANGTSNVPLPIDARFYGCPPGARRFGGRHEWGRQVAYATQFDTPVDRAHRGKARVKALLIGDCDPAEWELPPKPKWMRWRTYDALERKFDAYEATLHQLAADRLIRLAKVREEISNQ